MALYPDELQRDAVKASSDMLDALILELELLSLSLNVLLEIAVAPDVLPVLTVLIPVLDVFC